MLFMKRTLSLLGLNLLLRAHQALAQEDMVEFETEFRLMILTGAPDEMEIVTTDIDGVEWKEDHFTPHNYEWAIENDRGKADGNLRLSYMVFPRASDQLRKVWIYKKGEDKESGKVCTVYLNHDPQVPRLDWYLTWGLDFENTINEFTKKDEFKIQCTGIEGVPPPSAV